MRDGGILDLAPTRLTLLGLPGSAGMQGRLLPGLLRRPG
jgi:hypothetical protein